MGAPSAGAMFENALRKERERWQRQTPLPPTPPPTVYPDHMGWALGKRHNGIISSYVRD